MKALLWKDCRINRLVLIVGAVMVFGPLVVGIIINGIAEWRYGFPGTPWPELIVDTGILGLVLSLLTITLLGGNAVASERVDHSAEFLAYLPASRWAIITSKALLAVVTGVLVWAVGLLIVYSLGPLAGEIPAHAIRIRIEAIPALATTSVFLFGAAWLGSCCLASPTMATGIGFGAPWLLYAALAIWKFFFDHPDFPIGRWYYTLAVSLGVLCFIAGIVYYVRRVEP